MITQEEKQDFEDALATKRFHEKKGWPVPAEVLKTITEFEEKNAISAETPIYDKLKLENEFGVSAEKEKCVVETVDELLSDAPNATDPGLLLGKIQCGKTDTFEMIVGRAFDKGFDIAIVLTKGTKALVNQTISRMEKDYRFFKESDDMNAMATIVVEDIMNNRGGFDMARVNRAKTVIVAKKEATNLKHLINVFKEKSPWMCDKKVLIVDDEADFASRNYRNVKRGIKNDEDGNPEEQTSGKVLARISQQIDELRQLPKYCRYLQVTATPYCLFLQPDGTIDVEDGVAMPFRPRFTKLVPIHDKYIGGDQYFVDSTEKESMFWHLFQPVSQKCVKVMGNEYRKYLTSGIASNNIWSLTQALVTYLLATAVRRIQQRAKGKLYSSSAVIHVNVDKDNHGWQAELITRMLQQLKVYFTNQYDSDIRLKSLVDTIYKDFAESNQKARETGKINRDAYGNQTSVETISVKLPQLDEVFQEVANIFSECELKPKIVNSDNDMASLLDRNTGQLRLDAPANIFIGGSILDRGITINNMLMFFYGRDPKRFQQDTVLQHARFYGARNLKDMAVTRLFTTETIYQALAKMHNLDNQLRAWFINGCDNADPKVTFVGYDNNITPCAPSKIKPSKAIAITEQKYFAPKGMWTGSASEISQTVDEIDQLITSAPGYSNKDVDGFFEMEADLAMTILHKIHSIYRYNEDKDNLADKDDMLEQISALHYCAQHSGGKIWALHSTGRNMSRVRQNGAWVDMPADGRTQLTPARAISTDRPVLILLRENGKKDYREVGFNADGTPQKFNFGWNNAPFYWPVFLTQKTIPSVLFAISQKDAGTVKVRDFSCLTEGINPDEILTLTFKGDMVDRFGEVNSEYELEDAPYETRAIRDTTAAKFFKKDLAGNLAFALGVEPDNTKWAGVYTFNDGVLPYQVQPYKYMLLYSGTAEGMLLELFPPKNWHIFAHQGFDIDGVLYDYIVEDHELLNMTDILTDKNGKTTEFSSNDLCQWVIAYPVKKVLRHISFRKSQSEEIEEVEE